MKKLILILALFCFNIFIAEARTHIVPPDSCLKVVWLDYPHKPFPFIDIGFYANPSQIQYDSCAYMRDHYSHYLPTQNRLSLDYEEVRNYSYGKGRFWVPFEINSPNIFPRKEGVDPKNAIYTIDDIPSNFVNKINFYRNLEEEFGKFYIYELCPENSEIHHLFGRSDLFLVFDSLVHIASVPFEFGDWFFVASGVNDDIMPINELNIYPNLIENILNIKLNFAPINSEKIYIYSSIGEIVLSSEYKEQINVSSLPSGVYFIRYGLLNKMFIKK